MVKITIAGLLRIVCTDDVERDKLPRSFLSSVRDPIITNEVECEVDELRVIHDFVLINDKPVGSDELIYNDGVCITIRQEPIPGVVRMVRGMVLYDNGTLTYGNYTIRDVYDFTIYNCMVSPYVCIVFDDGSLIVGKHAEDHDGIRWIAVSQPPNPSIFACCVEDTLLSVSNDGELSYCHVIDGNWYSAPIHRYGMVHEIGYIGIRHNNATMYVIFNNNGTMELRSVGRSLSNVIARHVTSISILHRPRYNITRIKSAMS